MAEPVTPAPAEGGSSAAVHTAGPVPLPGEGGDAPANGKAPSLTPLLMKLRWTITLRRARATLAATIGGAIGVLYALGALAFGGPALITSASVSEIGGAFAPTAVGIGALLVLAWLLAPAVVSGAEDALSPAKFAILGRRGRDLQLPMLIASLISPAIILTALAIGVLGAAQTVMLVRFLAERPAGAISGLVLLLPSLLAGLAICILLPRAIDAFRSTRQSSRRSRELATGLGIIGLLVGMYGFSLISNAIAESPSVIDTIVHYALLVLGVIAWTPLGAPFAIPMDLLEGRYAAAVVRMLIASVTIAVLWLWWRRSLELALTQALQGDSAAKSEKVTALVPRFLRSTPFGASVGRSLKYMRRDARYSMGLLVQPVMVAFMVGMSVMSNNPSMSIFATVVVAWMAGLLIYNDIGMDGPANWVNIVAGIRGRTTLAARAGVSLMWAVPMLIIVTAVIGVLHDLGGYAGVLLLSALGVALSGTGIGVATAAFLPFAAPKPGSMKNSSPMAAWLPTLVSMLVTWLPMLPAMALIGASFAFGQYLAWIGAVIALVLGAVTLWAGIVLGGRQLDRHWPEVAQKVKTFIG
ncbi:hypothetical protein [Helcobacillus massiliensis]|uniref:ABC-2 type transport system permease protein n=1 Tax=Helcobacillus massiliensis TaxID=521392 RepID=A0A839QY50_9MICO|nr:hypothetical protein [Helcobacillus massiliensis]MBB3022881.1 ABC-2 type transport system permease protein [Helcobacillus massiliensis]